MAVVQLFQQISQEAFRKDCFCSWIEYSIIWKYTFTLSWKKCLLMKECFHKRFDNFKLYVLVPPVFSHGFCFQFKAWEAFLILLRLKLHCMHMTITLLHLIAYGTIHILRHQNYLVGGWVQKIVIFAYVQYCIYADIVVRWVKIIRYKNMLT